MVRVDVKHSDKALWELSEKGLVGLIITEVEVL